jgi:signal peptidase I
MNEKPRIAPSRQVKNFLLSWAPVIILVLVIRAAIVEAFMVPTPSMVNTIKVGDFMLVNKFAYGIKLPFSNRELIPVGTPRRNDIVVFRCPTDPDYPQPEENYVRFFPKWLPLFPLYWGKRNNPSFFGHRRGFVAYAPRSFIKRCVAVAGDTLAVRNKVLYVNGLRMDNPHISNVRREVIPGNPGAAPDFQQRWENMGFEQDISIRDNFGPVVIPSGHIMAMGDNRDNSWDSRFWGPLDLRYVRGKPLVLYFSYAFPIPPGHTEYNYEVNGINWLEILTHPFNVRPSRIGHILA